MQDHAVEVRVRYPRLNALAITIIVLLSACLMWVTEDLLPNPAQAPSAPQREVTDRRQPPNTETGTGGETGPGTGDAPGTDTGATARPVPVQPSASQSPAPGAPYRCVYFYTYATGPDRHGRFCQSLRSAASAGIELRVHGWGKKWINTEQKFGDAITLLKMMKPDCTMVFADAYDILYLSSPERFLALYDRMAAQTSAQLVFNAECECYPNERIDGGKACREVYPTAATPLRYLNTGAWIGPAATALRFHRHIMALIEGSATRWKKVSQSHSVDEQLFANFAYMDPELRANFSLAIDSHTTLFATMHTTSQCDPKPWYKAMGNGTYLNQFTGQQPALIHFNGNGKEKWDEVEGELSTRYPHNVDNTTFWFNGQFLQRQDSTK